MTIYKVHYLLVTETTCTIQILVDEEPMTFLQVFNAWQKNKDFVLWYNQLIAGNGLFEAIYWEHPPICNLNINNVYEMTFSDARSLRNVYADRDAFAEHFKADKTVVDFDNLRGDAHLVVPCPNSLVKDYTHLCAFTSRATEIEVISFWKRVGECCCNYMMGDEKRWLSTAGNGVYWLHVRLDTRPKYYKSRKYRTWTF